MKASDFAQWAGPRAMHIKDAVTVVSTVTTEQKLSLSAGFGPGGTVTTTPGAMVTAVTKTKQKVGMGTAKTTPPKAWLPENPSRYQRGKHATCGNLDNQEIEFATT